MKTILSMLLTLPFMIPLPPSGPDEAAATAASPRTRATAALALPLSSIERTDLAAAERASMHELLDIRGGEITNDNLWTILLVLGIVVLVVILI